MSKVDRFPDLMRAFFYEWLVEQRNASINTVRSYRDTLAVIAPVRRPAHREEGGYDHAGRSGRQRDRRIPQPRRT
ncbi:hypothetical protein [Aliihoeflea sp. 40Bstr573]|uniref:hypothetical protein n=1 Tax=Aliihoeflea sp. 40Bstr573 TaxID=2696467 RepID=UPI0020959E12|nr:hypothetical protein [Aliihoeflea sp. 40Bstr573]